MLLLLLAVEPVSLEPELPLEDDGGVLELLPDWSLLELLELEGELDELPLLSFLFIAGLPLPLAEPEGLVEPGDDDEAEPELDESGVERATEPGVPDELPDCERRESLPRSQADSPKVAASAAATAVRKNFLCSMSTIS